MIFYLYSCNENKDFYLACTDPCDSIIIDSVSDFHWVEYQSTKGKLLGKFVSFNNGDTIYGLNEMVGSLYKRTLIIPPDSAEVKLYTLSEGAYSFSEKIRFYKRELDTNKGHYLNIKLLDNNAHIIPVIPIDYDSIVVKSGEKIRKDLGGKKSILLKDYNSIASDSTFLLLLDFDKRSSDTVKSGDLISFPLNHERLDLDKIYKVDPWYK